MESTGRSWIGENGHPPTTKEQYNMLIAAKSSADDGKGTANAAYAYFSYILLWNNYLATYMSCTLYTGYPNPDLSFFTIWVSPDTHNCDVCLSVCVCLCVQSLIRGARKTAKTEKGLGNHPATRRRARVYASDAVASPRICERRSRECACTCHPTNLGSTTL